MTTQATKPVLTTLKWVPSMFIGHVRELRVRWALEEMGRPYDVRTVGDERSAPAYRQQQPFGQVPVYEENGVSLFESGAILHHLALQSTALMPADAVGQAQVTAWMFAALNSMEPEIAPLLSFEFLPPDTSWLPTARAMFLERAHKRVHDLGQWLKDREYLTGRFSAADILMASVLRMTANSNVLPEHPAAAAYLARCDARPAYRKALADHHALFDNAPAPAGV